MQDSSQDRESIYFEEVPCFVHPTQMTSTETLRNDSPSWDLKEVSQKFQASKEEEEKKNQLEVNEKTSPESVLIN
jgi:hypothetical protein